MRLGHTGHRSDGAKLYMNQTHHWTEIAHGEVTESASVEQAEAFHRAYWYAACTSARHEKRIAERLEHDKLEFFLPLYETVHQWKNGRKRLHLPLLPGYIFVRIPLRERLRVLTVPGVAYLVGTSTRPVAVSDAEIQMLRAAVGSQRGIEPHPYLKVGQRVRVIRGPLAGMEGILLRKKDNFRVVLSVDLVMRSVVLDVDGCEITPVSWSGRPPGNSAGTSKRTH